jgi:hypothetical protein
LTALAGEKEVAEREGFESFFRLFGTDLPELPLLALRVIGRNHTSQPSVTQLDKRKTVIFHPDLFWVTR